MYSVCPDSLCIVGETPYGIQLGFIESDIVIIIFTFTYLYLKKKSRLVQLINYQLFDLLISFELKSQILETNSHFVPELLICALGDITLRNLTDTACLLEWEYPNLFGKYKNFLYIYIYIFFVLGSRFACVRLLPFTPCNIMSTTCCPCMSGIS
jgi:hypothetical protein